MGCGTDVGSRCNQRKEKLNLCDNVVPTLRDGFVGARARIYMPFLGHYFASGETIATDAGNIPQDDARTMGAPVKFPEFSKGFGGSSCG